MSATVKQPQVLNTQKQLLLQHLKQFFEGGEQQEHLTRMMRIVNGETHISLRIVDWFVTNYSKKNFVVYDLPNQSRFKVYNEYKLKLKAYQKKNFDPFCRWERIYIPYNAEQEMETTIGQLNFFKWSIENRILDYIEAHYQDIEADMNSRNSIAKRKTMDTATTTTNEETNKTRKKREELSVSACKCIKKEHVKIIVKFGGMGE